MKKQPPKHPIEQNILNILAERKEARFKEMRPKNADSNLYSYHLTKLVKSGYVKKTKDGYSLDKEGLMFVDAEKIEEDITQGGQKISIMFVIQNSNGDTLLARRNRQPYIDMWTLPGDFLWSGDLSISSAAERILKDKMKITNQDVSHAGDCYMRVFHDDTILTTMLVHIFTFNSDDILVGNDYCWVQPHRLHKLDLVPGIDQIIARTFFRDPFYFEEFVAEW